ncbi:MAG: DUF4381 domain-containing protein [Gammaproteobacteria bacterium]|nr:DUF4381 domain-containing protein [Gammaproteobacteria bacterium]
MANSPLSPEVLAELKGLQMPPVPEAPLPWLWMILAAVLATLLIWAVVTWWMRRPRLRGWKVLFAEAQAIEDDIEALTALAVLCRRFVLSKYDAPEVARLSGASWVAYLSTQFVAPRAAFSAFLAEGIYRPDAIDSQTRVAIFADAAVWFEEASAR